MLWEKDFIVVLRSADALRRETGWERRKRFHRTTDATAL